MTLLTVDDLDDYQKYTIVKAIKKKYCPIVLGTGMGKTIIVLTIIDQLLKRHWINAALVIAPKKAMYNTWRQEAKLWKHTQYLKFAVIHGDACCGPSEYAKKVNLYSSAHIYLINYEGLPWLSKELYKYYKSRPLPWQLVNYDESTKMKHPTTARFRAFKRYMGRFEYRFPMTGTITPNGYMDLFGQVFTMDLGESLGTSITNYRNRFFLPITRDNHTTYKLIKGAKKAIARRLGDRVIVMRKEDYIKLPPIKYSKILLDLPDKLRGKYDELEQQFFIELENAKIEAFSSSSLSMKLRQFLQGKVYTGFGKERKVNFIHDEKLKIVEELMEGIGNCIVAYNFQFERDDLQSVFKDAPAIDGRTSDKDASKYILAWNKGKIPVFLYNPACDPHGLNLQYGGHTILWYSLTWNLEHYIQLIDRLWRRNQINKVMVLHVLFRGTIDEVVYEALQTKSSDQTTLIGMLKEYSKKKKRR